jgi:hypothetical protein
MSAEPQEERGAPGSRDTGSDQPSGGPTDRPSGKVEGDESVPAHDEAGKPRQTGGDKTESPPSDAKPAVPPYEGRQTEAKPDGGGGGDSPERTGGAVKPVTDPQYKDSSPSHTAGGATASPADEQPAAQMPESDRGDDRVGPSHTAGTGRGEDKR